MAKRILAWSPIRELMKKSGAEMVSKDAVDALISILEEKAIALTTKALEFCRHADRKKLTHDDMKLAIEM
ncbi:MAG TPA: histone [Candidatus Lokiarchaeia archaeon]|nr:histone [Candidatus Lokiarchaeia archaeon]